MMELEGIEILRGYTMDKVGKEGIKEILDNYPQKEAVEILCLAFEGIHRKAYKAGFNLLHNHFVEFSKMVERTKEDIIRVLDGVEK